MKKLIIGFAVAALLAPTAGFSQGISVGPGGLRMDSGDRYERRTESRGDYDRRDGRRWRDGRRGGCRTIIVKKRDEFGRRVTKRIERC
jgi:hypothetical protein